MHADELEVLENFLQSYRRCLAEVSAAGHARSTQAVYEDLRMWRAGLLAPQAAFGEFEEAWFKLRSSQLLHSTTDETAYDCMSKDSLSQKTELVLACADHGIADEGVSLYRKKDTARLVELAFEQKVSCSSFISESNIMTWFIDCGLAREISVKPLDQKLRFLDLSLRRETHNYLVEPAMSIAEVLALIHRAFDFVAKRFHCGCSNLLLGEFGIANTSSLALISKLLYGGELAKSARPFSSAFVYHKQQVLSKALARFRVSEVVQLLPAISQNRGKLSLVLLSEFGGFELVWLCGVILAAYRYGMVIVLDSALTVLAAAIALEIIESAAFDPDYQLRDILIASHKSSEASAALLYDRLGISPLFNCSCSAGEACAALMAYSGILLLDRCFRQLHASGNSGIIPGADLC